MPSPRALNLQEIERVARNYKEDLQRDANRFIRQHRPEKATIALEGMETVDRFVYQLTIEANSQIATLKEPKIRGKKPIEISQAVRQYSRKLL